MTSSTGAPYAAFISYRSTEPDRTWARWVHEALERAVVPRGLEGARVPTGRLGRCFLDREELGAAEGLGTVITNALARSGALIVVCSPRTPESPWVRREIEGFRRLNPDAPVLALLVEGTPAEAFPPSLAASPEDEPLAADVRSEGGASVKARRADALERLLAGILGVELDVLRRREQTRRFRRVRSVALWFAVLALGFAALAVYAIHERDRADKRAIEALERLGALHQTKGLALLKAGDLRRALAPLHAAFELEPKDPVRRLLLGRALRPFDGLIRALPARGQVPARIDVRGEGRVALLTPAFQGGLELFDLSEGRYLGDASEELHVATSLAVSADGSRAVHVRQGADGTVHVRVLDTRTGDLLPAVFSADGIAGARLSGDGSQLALRTLTETLWYDLSDVDAPRRRAPGFAEEVCFDKSILRLACIGPEGVRIYTRTDTPPLQIDRQGLVRVAFVDDDRALLAISRTGCELLDARTGASLWAQALQLPPYGTATMGVSVDGSSAWVSDAEDNVLWIDCQAHRLHRHLPPSDALSDVALSADGRLLGRSRVDGGLQVDAWDSSASRLLKPTAPADFDTRQGVTVSQPFWPQTHHALLAMNDGSVEIRHVSDGHLVRSLRVPGAPIAAASVLPTPGQFAVTSQDGTIWIWDYREPGRPSVLRARFPGQVTALAIDHIRERVVAGTSERSLHVVELGTLEPVAEQHRESTGGIASNLVTGIALTDDGMVCTAHRYGGRIDLWDDQLAERSASWDAGTSPDDPMGLHSGALALIQLIRVPGRPEIVGYGSNGALVWSPRTGSDEPIAELVPRGVSVREVHAWNPAQASRISCLRSDGELLLFDPDAGYASLPVPDVGGPVGKHLPSPDGRSLAVLSADGAVVRIVPIDGSSAGTAILLDQRLLAWAFAPGGERLALGRPSGEVEIVGVARGERSLLSTTVPAPAGGTTRVHLFSISSTPAGAGALAFTLDGDLLFVGHVDGTLQLWDVRSRTSLAHWSLVAPVTTIEMVDASTVLVAAGPELVRIEFAPPLPSPNRIEAVLRSLSGD